MSLHPFQLPGSYRKERELLVREGIETWQAVASLAGEHLRRLASTSPGSEARLLRLRGQAQLVVALDTSRRYAHASTLVRLSLFAVRRYFSKDAKVWSVQMFMYANESIVSAGPKHSSGVVLAGVFHSKPNILVVLVVVVMGALLMYFAFSAIYVFWLDRVQRKKGYFSFFARP